MASSILRLRFCAIAACLLLRVVAGLVVADLLDVLHGQRRPALGVAAGGVDRRADQAAHVDAVVAVEAAVLGGDERVLQVLRDLAQRDRLRGPGLKSVAMQRSCRRWRRPCVFCGGVVSCRLQVVFRNLSASCLRDQAEPADVAAAARRRRGRRRRPARRSSLPTSARVPGWDSIRDEPRASQGTWRRLKSPVRAWGGPQFAAPALSSVADRRAGRPGRGRRRAARAPATSGTSGWAAAKRRVIRASCSAAGGDLGVHPQRRLGQPRSPDRRAWRPARRRRPRRGRRAAARRRHRRGAVHPVDDQPGQRHPLGGEPLDEVGRLAQRVRLGRGDHDERGAGRLEQLVGLLGALAEAAEHRLERGDERRTGRAAARRRGPW